MSTEANNSRPPTLPVRQAYDLWSATYDSQANATRDLDAQVLREQLPELGGSVLEIGCGTGKNTSWLAERAKPLIAADLSDGMLRRAKKEVQGKEILWLQLDLLQAWPLRPASVDWVVEDLVLEHVRELEPFFREAFRVLRPGGRLFLCELHPYKQYQGGQARFTDGAGNLTLVEAFVHEISEFVNGGIAAGFTLQRLGEWRDSAPIPRLVSALFLKK